MAFDGECRKLFLEISARHGLDIDITLEQALNALGIQGDGRELITKQLQE